MSDVSAMLRAPGEAMWRPWRGRQFQTRLSGDHRRDELPLPRAAAALRLSSGRRARAASTSAHGTPLSLTST
eukprot:CAMPEP_0174735140 /NCGR_PEP_ID=MMETSP1094-20130205/64472_1 /TAXON_ID=156173 /ORGANISM="Chrysochromulina brevifilum, Strain UTEX LB 985" /LENGTH=71 /DNA_ID=CAMNT_0015938069 /DNA_START=104 /DNA_END=320 /DNA_ORIENTATION=-